MFTYSLFLLRQLCGASRWLVRPRHAQGIAPSVTQSIRPGSVSLHGRGRSWAAKAAKGPSTCSNPSSLLGFDVGCGKPKRRPFFFYGPSAVYQKPPVCWRLERLSGNKRLRLQQRSLWRGGKQSLRLQRRRVRELLAARASTCSRTRAFQRKRSKL